MGTAEAGAGGSNVCLERQPDGRGLAHQSQDLGGHEIRPRLYDLDGVLPTCFRRTVAYGLRASGQKLPLADLPAMLGGAGTCFLPPLHLCVRYPCTLPIPPCPPCCPPVLQVPGALPQVHPQDPSHVRRDGGAQQPLRVGIGGKLPASPRHTLRTGAPQRDRAPISGSGRPRTAHT